MADKDQIRNDEENVEHTPEEPEVIELDDQNLEDASGGLDNFSDQFADVNNNCVC